MTTNEALKMARDLLADMPIPDGYYRAVSDVICKLDAAMAQPAASEPVAWAQIGMRNGHTYVRYTYEREPYPPPADVVRNLNLVPLYAAPQQAPDRVPLTDSAIRALVLGVVYEGDASTPYRDAWAQEIGIPFARAIEAAHHITAKGQACAD